MIFGGIILTLAALEMVIPTSFRTSFDQSEWEEFVAEGTWRNRATFGNVRTFWVEQRLYMLMAMGMEEEIDLDAVEKFFACFELQLIGFKG